MTLGTLEPASDFAASLRQILEPVYNTVIEKRAIHARLCFGPGHGCPQACKTLPDKGIGAVRVMHVPGPMVHIEHLVGLSHGAQ